jgi:CheY-like chemotaxis protein
MPTILLVEDHELSRDALSRRLLRRGYRVVLAEDGQQGISLARSERPDLILMDLGLPKVDGWEATRLLKSDLATRHIPIIVLSAHATTNDREMALSAGSNEFDCKPVRFDRLLEKIELLLATSIIQ